MGLCHSSGDLRNRGGAGDFHRPYETQKFFTFHHSSRDTPSVSHSLDSSLREGAGNGAVPFNVLPGNRKGAGDFHRPYETQKFFTFHHSSGDTPSVSPSGCQLPQGGSREWVLTIQRAARKPEGCGRFSSPLRSSESFTFHHSTGCSLRRKGGGRFSSPLRNSKVFYISPFIGVVAKSEKGHLGEDGPWGGYFSRITGQVVFTALLM